MEELQDLELREFVKQTLLSIAQGVNDSIAPLKEYGAIVNPPVCEVERGMSAYSKNYIRPLQNVEFDLVVSANSGVRGAMDGSVGVVQVVSFGGNIEGQSENMSVSRIRFSVPIILPATIEADSR